MQNGHRRTVVLYARVSTQEQAELGYSLRQQTERLRKLRRQKVLSMRELEEISSVSYNTIWRLENGRTGAQPRTIPKIAGVMGVDPAELIKEEE